MSWYCRRCTIRHNRRWCFGGPLHWLVGVGRRMQLYWLRQGAVNIFGKEEGVHIGCSQRNRLSLRFCWALNTLERIATDPYISFCIHVRSSGHSSRQIPHVSPLQLIRPVLDRKAHRCISLACIEHALGWIRADAFVGYFGMQMLSGVRGLCLLWLADRLPAILVGGTHVSKHAAISFGTERYNI